jgi:[acyl-carrier-protein] S-malonyltransferase
VTVGLESDPAKIQKLMVEQITAPVPWVATVNKLVSLGVATTVECGPGKVLSGLNKRIQKELSVLATESLEQFQGALNETR